MEERSAAAGTPAEQEQEQELGWVEARDPSRRREKERSAERREAAVRRRCTAAER